MPAATTSIQTARQGNVTTPITVSAVVIGVRDTKEWYIEDPAGGPLSGVAVFCNPTAKTDPCPSTVTAPALHDLVTVTGTLSTFMGKVELHPTMEMTTMSNAALPHIPLLDISMAVASGNSNLRGTLVKAGLNANQGPCHFVVDNVTPPALYDSKCMGDGGAGTMASCSGCMPPTYGGFQVTGSTMSCSSGANEMLVENHFFMSENLQSSPECLAQPMAVPVTTATTFTLLQGILDFDPFGQVQVLMPVQDSDYVTP
jgi:hypothetical protein